MRPTLSHKSGWCKLFYVKGTSICHIFLFLRLQLKVLDYAFSDIGRICTSSFRRIFDAIDTIERYLQLLGVPISVIHGWGICSV